MSSTLFEFLAKIDHVLNFHFNAAPIALTFINKSESHIPKINSENICYDKTSCSNFDVNVNFPPYKEESFWLLAKNCAEEKIYDLTNIRPKTYFSADVQKEDKEVRIYLRRTSFPIRVTLSLNNGVIVQGHEFFDAEQSSIYPKLYYQYLSFSEGFLNYGLNTLNLSNGSILSTKV